MRPDLLKIRVKYPLTWTIGGGRESPASMHFGCDFAIIAAACELAARPFDRGGQQTVGHGVGLHDEIIGIAEK